MNFNRMSLGDIMKYASFSASNRLEVLKWISNEKKKQHIEDIILLIVSIVAFLLSITALLLIL